jgi:hypothetical protein
VASGTIPLKQAKRLQPEPAVAVAPAQPPARKAAAPQVPDWFAKLDLDGDGQVGLYEWKKAGRAVAEFLAIDENRDGFIEVRELLAYMAAHPEWRPGR